MWLLETDGDCFQGKTLWLKPGRRYLFGRTNSENGQIIISDKTISRKHLLITIEEVSPGEGSNPDIRSKVTLQDMGTKIGTLLDGKQIRSQTTTIEGVTHEITLGRYKHIFRLSWKPTVLTYASLKRKELEKFNERFEDLDIKIVSKYIPYVTTHVVSDKRNTPKGLQALIQGKFIVTEAFITDIETAAHIDGAPEELSSLETDFLTYWPKESGYLPPRREEPTDCSDEAYQPDPQRQDVMQGYTFIFYEKAQFNALSAPIFLGRGKALLHQAEPDITQVDDFIRYVKGVAGEKGLGEFEDGSEGKGVVVVRYQPAQEDPTLTWYSKFIREISLRLDHRLIEQNEFLDAVLKNDASGLRRPLEFETGPTGRASMSLDVDARAPPSTIPASSTDQQDAPQEEVDIKMSEATNPPRRGRPRRQITSRFKGFDDGWSDARDPAPTQTSNQSSQPGLFVSQDTNMEIEREPDLPPSPILNPPQKRSLSPVSEDEDVMEQLAPAAAQLKKRRVAESAARRARGETTPPPAEVKVEVKESPKLKKKKEVDLLEVARKRREELDEQARADRETLEAALDGIDINDIRKLIIVEEMPVGRSERPMKTTAHADESPRWDDRWNGRRNFKKFRRRGADHTNLSKLRNIVPLNEVRRKDLNSSSWEPVDSEHSARNKSGKSISNSGSISGSSGQAISTITSTDHLSASTRQSRRSHPLRDHESVPDSDDELPEQPPAASPQPSASELPGRSTRSVSATSSAVPASVTAASASQRTHGKRPAGGIPLTTQSPAKKMRQSTLRRRKDEDEDEDSEDELKFKFRR